MKVTKFAVEHSTAVFVLLVCLIIGGLISYQSLPREAAPDIPIPVVIVSTPYFGVSPADIETLVTQPMEKEFKGLRSLKTMTSTSAESVSLVTLEFETDVDIDEALQKVREKVDKVEPDLPPDAEESEVIEVNTSDFPVLIANVSGDMDPLRLKEIAESIQDDIEKISGVLRVDLAGTVEREIQVLVDPDKMRKYGVSPNQVIGTIQGENINLPGGSIEIGSMKYLLRVPGEFEDLETIRDLVIKAPQGQQILVRDVAEIHDGFKERETFSRLTVFEEGPDGVRRASSRPNVSLSVIKRAGENIITIAEASKEVIGGYQERMEPGVKVAILNDMSKDIEASVRDLENNIISGMLLVIAVLFFFMGGARNALMVSVSVPLSMLVTFIVLSAMGITLNMVVLFSLILALGMLVDNAIVIVENIYRHASEGKDLQTAAMDGTTEVGWAVIASTFTTVGAFFPMIFWPGVVGKFMGFLPLTVIITLLASLFVALIINPTIASICFAPQRRRADQRVRRPGQRSSIAPTARLAGVVDAPPGRDRGAVGGGVHRDGGAVWALEPGRGVLPRDDPGAVHGQDRDGRRQALESTDAIVRRAVDPLDGTLEEDYGFTDAEREALEARLAASDGLVEAWVEDVGVGGGQGLVAGGQAPHYARISVDLFPAEQQQGSPGEFMEALREVYGRVPGATIVLEKQNMGPPSGAPVNIEISGEELPVMAEIARDIKERIRTVPGLIDLEDDVELSRPEILVRVDRKRAALLGTGTQAVASTVRTAVNGTKASVFRDGEDEYDITVKLPEDHRRSVDAIERLRVVNRDGEHIPLVELATIDVQGGSGSIRHKDQDRVVSVSANAASGVLPAELLERVQQEVDQMEEFPAGYDIRYTGENEDQAEAGAFLGKAMLLALFIIALILVTQFNSITQPLIILSSVLLSLIGVLWSLILTGEPFGIIMTGIGIISLAGVVVNNSIVLIDYTNQLRDRGLDRREAVITAGMVRFRPVMLTAMTTILGLVPLVIGVSIDFVSQQIVVGGRSVEMWGPMARAVSSGLLVATVLTLVVVPVLYSLFDDISQLGRRGREALGGAVAAGLIGAIGLGWVLLTAQPAGAQPAPEAPAAAGGAEAGGAEPIEGDEDPARFSTPEDVGEGFEAAESDRVELGLDGSRVLSLEQALEKVRQDNFEVRAAMTNIAIADATIAKAYSTLFPTFVARFSSTLYDEEITADFGIELPDDVPIDLPETEPVVIRPQLDYNFSVSASMRLNAQAWPLLRQSYINQELSQRQVQVLRDELEFTVVRTYYNALLTQRVLEIRAAQLETERRRLRATERRREAGVVRPFELTRARLQVAQADQQLEQALQSWRQLRHGLAFLIQAPADFRLQEVGAVELQRGLAELKEAAVGRRPSVLIQDQAVALADMARQEIYWKYLPTLELSATGFRPRETAFTPGQWQFSLGLTAQWILWDGGLREAELDEREARLVAARIDRERSRAEVVNQLDQAWAEYLSTRSQLEASQTQVELAREGLEEAERAWRLGAAQQLDVIFAQDQLRVAELSRAQAELQLQLAVRKLRYLAGVD